MTITDASGPKTFNVCNGAQGIQGAAEPGFDGTYQVGDYKLEITADGVFLGRTGSSLLIRDRFADLTSGLLLLNRVGGGLTEVGGGQVFLGSSSFGCARPVARVGSEVTGSVVQLPPGSLSELMNGTVTTGSTKVFSC